MPNSQMRLPCFHLIKILQYKQFCIMQLRLEATAGGPENQGSYPACREGIIYVSATHISRKHTIFNPTFYNYA